MGFAKFSFAQNCPPTILNSPGYPLNTNAIASMPLGSGSYDNLLSGLMKIDYQLINRQASNGAFWEDFNCCSGGLSRGGVAIQANNAVANGGTEIYLQPNFVENPQGGPLARDVAKYTLTFNTPLQEFDMTFGGYNFSDASRIIAYDQNGAVISPSRFVWSNLNPIGTDSTRVADSDGGMWVRTTNDYFFGNSKQNGTLITENFITFGIPKDNNSADGLTFVSKIEIFSGKRNNQNTTVTTAIYGINPCPVLIYGNIFNDTNALTDNLVNGAAIGNPSGSNLYANLLDATGTTVVRSVLIAADGTYSLPADINTNYIVQISTIQGVANSPAPATSLPAGWMHTGDVLPTGAATNTTNGLSAIVAVTTLDFGPVNFGIQQPPTPIGNTAAAVVNPGGTTQSANVASLFTGTDPSVGTINNLTLTNFPTGATSFIVVGVPYLPSDALWPANGGAGLVIATNATGTPTVSITGDPSATGNTEIVFTFSVTDNANANSTTTATVTLPFFTNTLPVILSNFLGKQNGKSIKLSWKTTIEKGFSHFELQKSADSKEFGTIANINGKNASIYSEIDLNPLEGINYYRLKMVDNDGTNKLSNIISVRFEDGEDFVIVENPINNGEFKLITNLDRPRFKLLGSFGQAIEIDIIESRTNRFVIKTDSPAGAYYLNIESNGKFQIRKILKL